MLTKFTMNKFIRSLRDTHPVFELKNVVNNLERTLESTGILVKYADLEYPKKKNVITMNGYGYADKKNRPVFVLDGNSSYFKRRQTMAHLLGQLIMHNHWLPNSVEHKLSKMTEIVYIEEESRRIDDTFMVDFLLPNETELNNIVNEIKSQFSNEIVRDYMIFKILSEAYKVTEDIIKTKLEEEK